MLSKLGCSVAFGGRNKEELDKVAAKCKEDRIDTQVYNNYKTIIALVIRQSIFLDWT